MNVLALDPGGTTGVAMTFDDFQRTEDMAYTTIATDDPLKVWRFVTAYKWNVVLCERFATAGRVSKYGLGTVEIVGGVRSLCAEHKTPFLYRQPQHRKSAQKEAKDYLAGRPHVIHEEDALAHLLAYLHDHTIDTKEEADPWP